MAYCADRIEFLRLSLRKNLCSFPMPKNIFYQQQLVFLNFSFTRIKCVLNMVFSYLVFHFRILNIEKLITLIIESLKPLFE